MNELCYKGAAELAGMIASRRVMSGEVVDAYLARIEEVNPSLNAITATMADSARATAAEVDRTIASGKPVGPLAGAPFTVKENIDVAGSATTWGVAAMKGQIASADAPLVARMREAGAIPLARTNMPDLAFRWHTESSVAGVTMNPWDPTRTPGGSSGGEAVALATGMTPLGFGNDLGGSLRVPSQMCGTAAIRPSRGRVADAAVTEPSQTLVIQMTHTQGPMARHVADLRLALGIISAPDVRDPRWVPAPMTGPAVAGRTRVAVVRNPLGAGIDPHVAAGVARAADWLSDAGYDVAEAEPPMIGEAMHAWVDAIWGDIQILWPHLKEISGTGVVDFIDALLANQLFTPVDQAKQLETWTAIHKIGAAWAEFLAVNPIILSPVSCERPWPVGDDIARVTEVALSMRMVVPVNILGLPACAVPVGADGGLPQGIQLIGARFRESLLLEAAQAIEDRAPVLTPIQPVNSQRVREPQLA
ncbi:MAG: indole acetimide hydrolase, partial [Hyphomicrobiales bacterium]|nr:indole acetimide hydrolase [Hyphomicrobiales bacterium]